MVGKLTLALDLAETKRKALELAAATRAFLDSQKRVPMWPAQDAVRQRLAAALKAVEEQEPT